MARSSTIWTTESVNILIERMKIGDDSVKETPFFNNDPDLKNANIIFNHTPEELAEFMRCMHDCVYFTSKYCNFLTDFGRRPVKLREYQKNLLNVLTEERYDEQIGDNVPVNRDVILLQSRQTGKCNSFISNVLTNKGEIKIGNLYNDDKTIFSKIKKFLYKIYCKL